MRKLLTWLVVTLGVAALVRRLKQRRGTASAPTASSPIDDPATELRRKLAESRAESEPEESRPETTVAARRAEVHEEGRSTLDEMRARAEQ